MLLKHHGGWHTFHTICWLFHLSYGILKTLTKRKILKPIWYWCILLQNSIWPLYILKRDIQSFLLEFISFLTTTMSSLSNPLVCFPSFHSPLYLSLLYDTRMLNISICLNRYGYESSRWSKDCCTFELPSLYLAGERSVVNGNYLTISTNDQEMPVPSTSTALQVCSVKNTPCIYW